MMPSTAFGTIVAKSHLSLARVLAGSFHQWHPSIPFYVLLADDVDDLFDPADEPFELLTLDDLAVPGPRRVRFWYRQQELSYAMTPYLIGHLLDRGYQQVGYMKQESLVVGPLDATLSRLGRAPITLTPHLLAPLTGDGRIGRELNVLQSGVYNAGFVGVADSDTARRFLAWWQDRVHRHSRHDVPHGLHYEQRWLDLVPVYFPDTRFVRDAGFNVGHWNMAERPIVVDGEQVSIDGSPGSFVRFSGYDPDHPDEVTRYFRTVRVDLLGSSAAIFRRYQALLERAGHHETKHWPYAFEHFSNGIPIPDVARSVYRDLGDGGRRFGDPFDGGSAAGYYQWLCDRPDRLWLAVHRQRHDLQDAFPDPFGADRRAFADWTVTSGQAEHGIADSFRLPGTE